jgi:hypothetical protein
LRNCAGIDDWAGDAEIMPRAASISGIHKVDLPEALQAILYLLA